MTTIEALPSLTLAILLLFIGKGLSVRIVLLRRYGIPEPVIGGVLCAVVVCALYYGAGTQVTFDLEMRDILLLYFFAALGLNSNMCVHRPMTDGIPDGWRTAFRWHGGQCSGMMPDSSG